MGILPPGIRVPDNVKLYVLHASDGSVLGFTDAWEIAYGAAYRERADAAEPALRHARFPLTQAFTVFALASPNPLFCSPYVGEVTSAARRRGE